MNTTLSRYGSGSSVLFSPTAKSSRPQSAATASPYAQGCPSPGLGHAQGPPAVPSPPPQNRRPLTASPSRGPSPQASATHKPPALKRPSSAYFNRSAVSLCPSPPPGESFEEGGLEGQILGGGGTTL